MTQGIQPARYKDGKDTVGQTFDGFGLPMPQQGVKAPDLDPTDFRDGDAGFAALDYNFGELAVTTGKTDFIRPIFYR